MPHVRWPASSRVSRPRSASERRYAPRHHRPLSTFSSSVRQQRLLPRRRRRRPSSTSFRGREREAERQRDRQQAYTSCTSSLFIIFALLFGWSCFSPSLSISFFRFFLSLFVRFFFCRLFSGLHSLSLLTWLTCRVYFFLLLLFCVHVFRCNKAYKNK